MAAGMNKVVLDTSALIELFDLSASGMEVRKIIEQTEEVLVPVIVLAELISKLKRRNFEPEKFVSELEAEACLLPLDAETAKNAASLHAELRKTENQISLAGCIIMSHAEKEEAVIITKDSQFRNFKNILIL